MPAFFRSVLVAAMALVLLVPSAHAEETGKAGPDPDQVLVTVNGTEITLGHVIALRADLPPQYDQFPSEVLFKGILDQLIQQTLLMQSFDGELSRRARLMLENETRAIHAGEAISALMAGRIDDAALRAAYEAKYPENSDQKEYHAAHILVKTEEEAARLVEELKAGANFAALARKHSVGPSKEVGGDLGWFSRGDMVEPFFEAVTRLEPGAISEPVKTDFGWHVIKLIETRNTERPDFESVRAELANELQQKILEEQIAKLSAEARIERADMSDIDFEAITDQSLLEN